MPKRSPVRVTEIVRAIGPRPKGRAFMLAGVSVLAVMAAMPRLEAGSLRDSASASVSSAPAAAVAAAQAAALQAAQQATTSINRASQAIRDIRLNQLQARNAAALAPGAIPNGLAIGGLEPDSGLSGNGQANTVTSWTGALTPGQRQVGGKITVDIAQTQPKAILNWKTFNVGSNTAVNFHQEDANGVHTDWTALNRIDDPTGRPSQILGQITAPGAIYIINRNGIVFGAGSQVNVTALVASSLDVGPLGSTRLQRDQFFINNGITTTGGFSISSTADGGDANTAVVGGEIRVEAGASITTALNAQDSPGFVYLFGSNVFNAGTITSPAGEVAMVAARTVTLNPGAYIGNTLPKDPLNSANDITFRGTGFTITHYAASYQASGSPTANSSYLQTPGLVTGVVTQAGLIETPRGTALLSGDKIVMSGVISADTSVTRNSSVLMDAATGIDLSGTISVQPYFNGESLPFLNGAAAAATASNVQAFIPAFVFMGAYDVTMASTGLISAPSATVSLRTDRTYNTSDGGVIISNSAHLGTAAPNLDINTVPQRVLMQPGAVIDVAGLQNVVRPASDNFIAYTPRGTEFADTPLQRDGVLVGKTLYIDVRQSGTRGDGTTWLGTPLGNANGFVNAVPQGIDVLMTKGGTVSLGTEITGTTLRDVVLLPGSLINVAGGSVKYLPGQVPFTVLIGADGRRYGMTNADPNITYVGVLGETVVAHPHWGVKDSFANRLMPGWRYEAGYVEGRDAGGIAITTLNPVLDGDVLFGSVMGERQIAGGKKASGTLANGAPSQSSPYELPSQGYLSITAPVAVVIGNGTSATLPPDFTPTTPLPKAAYDPVPTDLFKSQALFRTDLSAAGLSGLSALVITASDLVLTKDSEIDMAPGGSVLIKTAGGIDLQGRIVAHSGQIKLTTDNYSLSQISSNFNLSLKTSGTANVADIRIGGVLDTSGLWVNDTGITVPALATGPAFINGGAISIATNYASGWQDATGSIILGATSVLDASSGGYIGVNGKLKTSAFQVPAGKGGNISLAVYQGTPFIAPGQSGSGPQGDDGTEKYANVLIDPAAVIRSYGFTSNGELLIAAPRAVQIGGAQNTGANLWLPTSLFTTGGFSKYTVQSVADYRWKLDLSLGSQVQANSTSITLAAGETLTLSQRNYSHPGSILRDLPTGTTLGGVLSVATLPDDQRAATGLTFGSDYVLLDTGSAINADARAAVVLRGTQSAPTTTVPVGYDPGVSSLLLGKIVSHGGQVSVNAKHVWLGSQALIDVSGTFVANSTFGQVGGATVNGKLLAGGNVTLASDPGNSTTSYNSYVVGQSGANIDVSGASATLRGIGAAEPVDAWSDGGTLTIAAMTLLWDGRFAAKAGAPQGNDGTLIIGGGQVYLAQSVTATLGGDLRAALAKVPTPSRATGIGDTLPAGLASFAPANNTTNNAGNVHVTVDKLAEFGTIFLYSDANAKVGEYFPILDSAIGAVASYKSFTLKTVGNIDWSVGQRLYLGAQAITQNSPASTSTVNISAPYVLLTTGVQSTQTAASGNGTLTFNGATIDVESAVLSGFSSVNLVSTGDIRLSTPRVLEAGDRTNITTNPNTFSGTLTTPGSLLLQAQRIYPVTNVDFTIQAGAVTFSSPVGSNTRIPLSAGGSVTVLATTIAQNGNLFAPLGKIVLGDATAQSVTLGAGSLTSVSLKDVVVPYGATEDGVNWYYNDNTNPLSLSATATTFLPTKSITLTGRSVTLQSTATVDVSGGGDLQANEFVQGKGGTIDTLARRATGPIVYALLPSSTDPVAAFDIDFIYRLRDSQPLVGQQVYLAGGNGIAAGTYTLYPAHYATLPGALRVVDYGSALGRSSLAGATLADRTQLVGGYYVQSTKPGGRSSGTELFAVQTNDVWRQYSEITGTSANSYFYDKSVHDGVNVPYLPIDAGRLAISAQNTLVMNATARASAEGYGRPGQLDLSSSQIALIAPGQTAPDGYLGVDVTQISQFGSVLIGGLRSDRADGTTLITAFASQVLVDTHGVEFAAPEIILVAAPSVAAGTLNQIFTIVPSLGNPTTFNFSLNNVSSGPADPNSGNIVVAAGSVIHATGTTGNAFARRYVTPSPATATDLATALGGTLSADGTTITGAKLSLLQNNDPTVLALLKNYSGSQTFGAMMALTSDPLLSFGNLIGTNNGPLQIKFVPAATTSTVTETLNLPGGNGNNTGTISIAANADVRGQSLMLNATKSTAAISFDQTARFDTTRISLVAKNYALGTAAASAAAVTMTTEVFDRLADGHYLSLKALGGGIEFYGAPSLDSGRKSLGVTLDAPFLAGHSGDVSIGTGGTLTLLNSGQSGTTSQTATAGSVLSMNADQIDLGGGNQTIAGFGAVAFAADTRVFVRKAGSLQLGLNGKDGTGAYIDPVEVDLTMTTPNLLVGAATSSSAGTGSQFLISTRGRVTVDRPSGSQGGVPAATTENGGYLEIDAKAFALSGAIQAQGGTLVIHTTGTDPTGTYGIRLADGAYVAAGGFKQSFFDLDRYISGGTVTFTADAGDVYTAPGSTIDLAQPKDELGNIGFGYGGELVVNAAAGLIGLNGALDATTGAAGHGGIIRLDGLALSTSLDALADSLVRGGVNGGIDIHTRQGNLTLSQGHTLQAHAITIVADAKTGADTTANGNLTIAGTIDARGEDAATLDGANQAGGQVGLWGANSVRLASTGSIRASTTHADERGGDVVIGVGWNAPWNPTTKIGGINLEAGSTIDVSGGTKGGLSGGTVKLRAPEDGLSDVKIQNIGSTVSGARAVNVEGYVAFDTGNTGYGIDGSALRASNGTAVIWDGIIDPAGWFNSDGTMVNGKLTNVTGWKLDITPGSGYTSKPYFTLTTGSETLTIIGSLKIVTLTVSTLAQGTFSSFPTATFSQPNTTGLANGGTPASATVNAGLRTVSINPVATTLANGASVNVTDSSGNSVVIGTAIITGGQWTGVTIPTTSAVSFTSAPTALTIGSGATKATASVQSATYKLLSLSNLNGGEGYSAKATVSFTGQTAAPTVTVSMGITASITSIGTAAYETPTLTQTTAAQGGSGGSIKITSSSALSGTLTNGVFQADANAAGYTLLLTNRTDTGTGTAIFTPTTVNTAHSLFYSDVLARVSQGTWFSADDFAGARTRLGSYLQANGQGGTTAGAVHLQPGIDLINSRTTVNKGDITVATNWNLAAGTAYSSNNTALAATDKYNFATSYIDFIYRLGLEPGTLSLRAVRDVNIAASISDGFFGFRNYNDATYLSNVLAYIKAATNPTANGAVRTIGADVEYYLNSYRLDNNGAVLPVPVAPYALSANGISPTAAALVTADVFPTTLQVCTVGCGTASANTKTVQSPGSWSYRVTAGADIGSANPNAVVSLATFGDNASAANAGHGNVIVTAHATYDETVVGSSNSLVRVPVNVPTMLRTGTGAIDIAAARNLELTDQAAPGVIYTAGVNTALPVALSDPQWSITSSRLVANNPLAFYEPQLLLAFEKNAATRPQFGQPNAAAFPQMGGDITIEAQQDVIGFQNVQNAGQSATLSFAQFYSPWLLSTTEIGLQNTSNYLLKLGAGVFQPSGTTMMQQSAWWIQFSSFDQGVMSIGGNVTLRAGRDVRDFSVSLPTTGRVSGGLSQTVNGQLNTPVLHLYDSGNMTISVGRALASGTFYEGSGHAEILVRGSVISDVPTGKTTSGTVLALDSGQIALTAGGSISLSGIVNPPALRKQTPTLGGYSYSMETYGPDSAVRLSSGGGNITLSAPPAAAAVAKLYPSSLEAVAFTGSITVADSVVLADSLNGGLDLLANGSISGTPVSTGASLIDAAFNPFAPNNGYDAGTSKALLAHSGDTGINHLYAVTGNIGGGNLFSSNRAVAVRAGGDILDLNMVAQNVNLDDVSSVIAGRDIRYTGKYNYGGLQIAGPGFLLVEAGRDLGPFLPLAYDTTTLALFPEGIQSIGNNGMLVQQGNTYVPPGSPSTLLSVPIFYRFPVGNWQTSSLQPVMPPNPAFLGPIVTTANTCNYVCFSGIRNYLLPNTGASIVAMFGVGKGINYQGVIDAYLDPAKGTGFKTYQADFADFLVKSGKAVYLSDDHTAVGLKNATGLELALFETLDPSVQQVFVSQIKGGSPAAHMAELREFLGKQQFALDKISWPVFNALSKALQDIFVVDLYMATLKSVGQVDGENYLKYQVGYKMVDTLFPAEWGYTRNALDGGTNGANRLVKTGDLDLLHATLQTQKGGDISILGPGGSILVGSVATEPNTNLKPNYLGILTLAGGGISTFTDQSVLVNASRVMTWYGGDILMWSSNGDIDAGRGARTTLSYPPLKVNFNPDDIETVDLGGLVSGAGIAVLQTQSFARRSDAYLLAPRGTVDAGDAGIRVSGDLSILAVHIANADNIQAQGKISGIPTVVAPDVGKLATASNATAGTQQAGNPTASRPGDNQASVIIVEILGYGGGDGPHGDPREPEKPRRPDGRQSYDPNSNVRVLGYSTLGESEMIGLTETEKEAIRN
ncbi:MAG: filamentous hemagglutinin family protein [Rhodoplanes sp.]|uniref:filamentous haemagglutinin family protein n=1 Tax=Rhodoplanes sp. TaxID=1968906 RepID=UPI00184C59AD|nr:filamentous haemagglutinin family protein [Rhodoplanes sp.]NVO13582.1 filamentous hemagglutinin family protein [Rhodoplanes sp.]